MSQLLRGWLMYAIRCTKYELNSNVVNLDKGDRKGRPYKCLGIKHIRRGDLHGRPYLGGVINN